MNLIYAGIVEWNSRVEYYLTLIFIFIEDKQTYKAKKQLYPMTVQKKSQIKLRVIETENSTINQNK